MGSNFLTLLATTVIISGYAIGLGFQARGVPDVNQISAFADQIAPMATLVLQSAFTLIAGWSVAGRNLDQAIQFGFLVGLAVVILRFVMALAGGVSLEEVILSPLSIKNERQAAARPSREAGDKRGKRGTLPK